jgi:hypothetical protein
MLFLVSGRAEWSMGRYLEAIQCNVSVQFRIHSLIHIYMKLVEKLNELNECVYKTSKQFNSPFFWSLNAFKMNSFSTLKQRSEKALFLTPRSILRMSRLRTGIILFSACGQIWSICSVRLFFLCRRLWCVCVWSYIFWIGGTATEFHLVFSIESVD